MDSKPIKLYESPSVEVLEVMTRSSILTGSKQLLEDDIDPWAEGNNGWFIN